MLKFLFVCIENSNRSQMAEAFANIFGDGNVEAYSAGSRPSGKVNPKAINAMKLLNYDLSTHKSKSLDEIPDGPFDAVITMGCGEECPWIPAKHHRDWAIPDPRNLEGDEFLQVRNIVRDNVHALIEELALESFTE